MAPRDEPSDEIQAPFELRRKRDDSDVRCRPLDLRKDRGRVEVFAGRPAFAWIAFPELRRGRPTRLRASRFAQARLRQPKRSVRTAQAVGRLCTSIRCIDEIALEMRGQDTGR